jgi:hypothetical protein
MCNRYQLSDCGERHECREKQPDDRVMEWMIADQNQGNISWIE